MLQEAGVVVVNWTAPTRLPRGEGRSHVPSKNDRLVFSAERSGSLGPAEPQFSL